MSMVAITGEVVSPPQFEVTPAGSRRTTLVLRVPRTILGGSSDFLLTFFDSTAEHIDSVVVAGDWLAVEGRIRYSTCQSKDPSKPCAEVVCNRWRPANPTEVSA